MKKSLKYSNIGEPSLAAKGVITRDVTGLFLYPTTLHNIYHLIQVQNKSFGNNGLNKLTKTAMLTSYLERGTDEVTKTAQSARILFVVSAGKSGAGSSTLLPPYSRAITKSDTQRQPAQAQTYVRGRAIQGMADESHNRGGLLGNRCGYAGQAHPVRYQTPGFCTSLQKFYDIFNEKRGGENPRKIGTYAAGRAGGVVCEFQGSRIAAEEYSD